MNINGATFNSGISIPSYVNKYTLPRLSYSERARLRDFAFWSTVVHINEIEISMVSNIHVFKYIKDYVKYLAA